MAAAGSDAEAVAEERKMWRRRTIGLMVIGRGNGSGGASRDQVLESSAARREAHQTKRVSPVEVTRAWLERGERLH